MNYCLKSWLYTLAAILLTGVSSYYQVGLHDPAGPEMGHYALHRVMLVLSFVLFGVAVYAYISHPKRTPQYRWDRLFLLLVGLGLLIITLVIWIWYGGSPIPFDSIGYTAVNLQIVSMTLLPIPFLIRGGVLAFSYKIEDPIKARSAKIALLLGVILFVVCVAVGWMFRMMTYQPVWTTYVTNRPTMA